MTGPQPTGSKPADAWSGVISYDQLRAPVVRHVAQLMAAAAMTAPKSGGQLLVAGSPVFMETVVVDDRAILHQLAGWMRARGAERREPIWFRDADATEAIDGVLFVGLVNPYPPNYDCGACGYATCAEFLHATKQLRADSDELEFTGPTCNLRDIDLGIAVGSAARTAAVHCVDCRCQTRIAVAARKLGVITAELAVGLSLSLTHKAVAFDRRMPEIDFDTLEPTAGTGLQPIGIPGAVRGQGARNKQRARQPVARPRRKPKQT
jgi:uncharacterized ferredoxin-like protein